MPEVCFSLLDDAEDDDFVDVVSYCLMFVIISVFRSEVFE